MGKVLKLGVMVPMKNHTFMKGTAFDSTCTVAVARGASSVECLSRTPSLLATLNKGDYIKLGASTVDSNLRATEELMVSVVGSDASSKTTINFDSTNISVFEYSTTDRISGVGNYFPDSWTAPTAAVINAFDGNIYFIPRLDGLNLPDYSGSVSGTDKTNVINFTTFGVDDYYCQKIVIFCNTKATSQTIIPMRYDFNTGDFLTSTYYRVGFFYRYKIYDNTGGDGVSGKVIINDGSSNIISKTYFNKNANIEESDWSLAVSSSAVTASSLSSAGYALFYFVFAGGDARKLIHNLDCVWVEHAKNTDDDTAGVYTFTEHPAIGSQQWNFTEFRQKTRTASGVDTFGQKDGRKRARYVFTCRFEDVSSTFWKNLLILQQWNRLGYKIVFHTSEDFVSRVPPVLVGSIKIRNVQKNHWDSSLKSFTFEFFESE